MQTIKFSVVLPIYNVEKYLRKCLDSIINQTYSNLEIICVNDGSTDNSLDILKEYEKKDKRIKIISQKNQGQGVARNNGIKLATGEYINFIDPDDWVELNMFESLNNFLEKSHSEVVEFKYKTYFEADKNYQYDVYEKIIQKKCGFDIKNSTSYSWKSLKDILLSYKSSCCIKTYLRTFIIQNNILFSPHKNGEDIPFSIGVLFKATKIDLLHECFYIYRKRANSSTTLNKKESMLFLFEQIDTTKDFLIKNNLFEILKKDFYNYQNKLIYDADKKCSKEYKKIVNKKAKEYLSSKNYFKFTFKKNTSRLLRNIFSVKRRYNGTNKTYMVIFGLKFII